MSLCLSLGLLNMGAISLFLITAFSRTSLVSFDRVRRIDMLNVILFNSCTRETLH